MKNWVAVFLLFSVGFYSGTSAKPPKTQNLVRCKIGVSLSVDGKSKTSKQEEKVKAGSELRLYVIPETSGYLYIIHSDNTTSSLLNEKQVAVLPGVPVRFPDADTLTYEIDGLSQKERFCLIFSPQPVKEINDFFKTGQKDYQAWSKLETSLKTKAELRLSESSDKPFAIAGNVRGGKMDPFLDNLRVYSGVGMVVRTYVYQIKK